MGEKLLSPGTGPVAGLAKSVGLISRLLRKDSKGLAAIEFALIASFLAVAVLNVADISVFLFDELQVNNATQMGVQAAWATCDLNHVPVTTKCPAMNGAITTAVQSTALGNSVTLQSGSPTDGYYCPNSAGALQYMSDYTSRPADCSAAGVGSTTPAEYVKVMTTYPYTAIFPGLSVASVFPAAITATSYVRISG